MGSEEIVGVSLALSAANNQPSDRDLEARNSCHDSLSCTSQPKLRLQELNDNIHLAVSNYDSIKKQWEYMKAMRVNQEEGSSRKSSVTLSSLNLVSSDHSRDDVTPDDENLEPREEEEAPVEIVMNPRSPSPSKQSQEDVQQASQAKSLESIGTRRSRKTAKRKRPNGKKTLNEETLKLSLLYNAKPKKKKQSSAARLRNSNSKSTVMTRDPLPDKRPERRKFRRQRSLETVSGTTVARAVQFRRRLGPLKTRDSRQPAPSARGLVKLFQSQKALQSGSLATVSSVPTKIEASPEEEDEVCEYLDDESQANAVGDSLARNKYAEEKIDIETISESEGEEQPSGNAVCCQANEEQPSGYGQSLYDPFQQRNYEMPTTASRMKQVHRSHYGFNIRGIPFVVGTSLSPSHNLGLNIQQVLNVIKMKKPATLGINPMLIRKCSKGLSPVSLLLNELSHECMRSCQAWNCQEDYEQQCIGNNIGSYSSGHLQNNAFANAVSNQAGFKQSNVACEPLYEEDEECRSMRSDGNSVYQEMREKQSGPDDTLEACQRSRYHHHQQQRLPANVTKFDRRMIELNIADENSHKCPKSNKEMMDIFSRLYEQFDKMISQHEKLKEQLEKRKDKALMKEMAELEAAMNAKEQEIAAVVSLYTEVMSLRQQMRQLRERNSLACLTHSETGVRQSGLSRRAHTALPYEAVPGRRSQSCGGAHRGPSAIVCHEPPHSLRLTSLLRQIRAFHRQLSLF